MSPRRWPPIIPIAWRFVIPSAALAIVSAVAANFWAWAWIATAVFALAAAFCLYFFRDPERKAPNIPGAMVSPADGRVVSVEEVADERFPGGRARRIGIFLSVFDVHVQRAPFDAQVENVEYQPGKFLNALNDKSSEDNEHTVILMRHGALPLVVRQIAGAIARRIICPLAPGEHLTRGQRIGLICFGSRVEALLPLEAEIRVRPGLSVRGGESVLAILNGEKALNGR